MHADYPTRSAVNPSITASCSLTAAATSVSANTLTSSSRGYSSPKSTDAVDAAVATVLQSKRVHFFLNLHAKFFSSI